MSVFLVIVFIGIETLIGFEIEEGHLVLTRTITFCKFYPYTQGKVVKVFLNTKENKKSVE